MFCILQLCMYELELVPLHMSLCVLGTVLMYVHVQLVTWVNTLIMFVLLAFLFR